MITIDFYGFHALASSALCISSLYLYGAHKAAIRLSPLHAFIPSAVVVSALLLHFFTAYSFLFVGILAWAIFLIPRTYIPFMLHGLLCGVSTLLFIAHDKAHHTKIQSSFFETKKAIKGMVVDITPTLLTPQRFITTVQLSDIKRQPEAGIIKFLTPKSPPCAVGDEGLFFNVQFQTRTEKNVDFSLLRDHCFGICFAPYIKARIFKQRSFYGRWLHWWDAQRSHVYKELQKTVPPKTFMYISSLFFGLKQGEKYLEMRAQFARWGLTHYLARSGLHISLLVSLWSVPLRFLPLSLSTKALIMLGVLFVYNQLSWANISFNRALWLWFFYLGSWLAGCVATPLFGFGQLLTAILLFNPWQACCLDFQLSFFLTFVLMLLGYLRKRTFALSYCITKKK